MDAAVPDEGAIEELARALARPGAFGPDAPEAEWLQTHISHVFLVGDRVYKLRKAVRLSFLDFGTRAARNLDCEREVALNRRLAPAIYLGVASLRPGADGVEIGEVTDAPSEPALEHAVVMRRLTPGCDAISLLDEGRLRVGDLEAVAERLREFHATHGLGRPAPWTREAWAQRIESPLLACLAPLAASGLIEPERIDALESQHEARFAALRSSFEQRRVEGRAVDGHGDVHLDHVWFEPSSAQPLLVDCIEFNDDLRRIDVAAEVAFVAMDLRYRGRADLAEAFLAAYALRSDDYGLYPVVDWYSAYRALVRAKVAAILFGEQEVSEAQRAHARESVSRHFDLAESLLADPGPASVLVLCGTVGSGKSSAARSFLELGAGVPIVSDRVRKRLAGLDPTDHSSTEVEVDSGIYRADWSDRVYAGLLERAEAVLASGRTAVLDASFAQRGRREVVRRWCETRDIACRLLEVRCDEAVQRERLRARERAGSDPSDAGLDFLSASRERFEEPEEWPAADRLVAWSDDEESLAAAIARVIGRG